ncbi:glycosyltransferase [Actinomyces sp. oral taxon 448]|uniref:glycosyltransferase n=1 Tax=Actinomyces sp. oral taxon 448 TaxID=712124 RepID=UPI0002188906|nr:glycosyltransferase [Actinomyces sp. oral taxon 448]EGQ72961.1 glycosyl transferase family protein [Actinomyces sp. oral taxon 448 str. F0400]
MSRTNVVAVVVAYNRQELLRRCLDGLAGQTAPPAGTVVVDNASTDASARVAAGHPLGAHVVSLPVNTGGAGGFAAGIARALTRFPQAEWIWLMDDDTIPTATALEALVGAAVAYPGSPALLASRAVWADGTEHPMNRPRTRPGLPALLHRHAALAGARQIRTASFVSILIDARAVREVGLPRASYFLWNDDFEYTSRILRGRIGLYVPDSVVRHLTRALGSSDADPGERFRFEVRNKIWTFRDCEGLGPIERAAYEAATARRWLRAAASSADRATLWRAGREGLREGLARPADNMTIFLGTPVQDDVAAVEAAARASAGPTSPSPGPPSPATADPAGTPAPPFSVLLPVYRGDRADFLRRSLASVTVEQTLPPDEVLIVRDGPVPGELDDVLAAARRGELSGGVPVRVLELAENAGLALALDAGLEHVAHEVVARQDADDISVPERFATQLPLLAAGYDLIGSAIREFSEETDTGGVVRRQPADPERIRRAMTLRDPFNHPSVVYRASAVRAAGGYEPLDLMEDYWLFARMIRDGVRATNVPDVLVRYRVGAGAYARRGGGRLLHSELELQARMHRAGITTTAQYVRNIAVRAGYRLVPTGVRRTAYRTAQRALLKRTR